MATSWSPPIQHHRSDTRFKMKIFACGFGGITNMNGDAHVAVEDIHFLDQFIYASPMLGARHFTLAFEKTMADVARAQQHDVTMGPRIYVPPAAPIADSTGSLMIDNLVDAINRCESIDAVIILMAGALFDLRLRDLSGSLLEKIREAVGEKVFIGVMVGEYGPVTIPVLANADAVISTRDTPAAATASCQQLIDIASKTVTGHMRAVTCMFNCQGAEAVDSCVFESELDGLLSAMNQQQGVVAASICWSAAGASTQLQDANILVVTNDDFELGRVVAENIGTAVIRLCKQYSQTNVTVREAFRLLADAGHRLTVLVDTGDNPSQGANGKSTVLLQETLTRSIHNVAMGPIYSPDAVATCLAAGVGARVVIHLQGAYSAAAPIKLTVTVEATTQSLKQLSHGQEINSGSAVLVSIDARADIQLVLTLHREETLSMQLFTELGIRLDAKRVLITKSAHAPKLDSLPQGARVLRVATAGATYTRPRETKTYRANTAHLGV